MDAQKTKLRQTEPKRKGALDLVAKRQQLLLTKTNNMNISADKPVLVQFTADWCGPCRMMKPIMKKISSMRDDVEIQFLNVDQNPKESIKYGIRSIPTILLFENGTPTQRYVLGPSVDRLNQWLDFMLKKAEV